MTVTKKTTYRPTWAEIDLNALRRNLEAVRGAVACGVGVMAVVKADAYGHGLLQVSRVLCERGVEYLGVATVDEALSLRENGISCPVLVLGSVLAEEAVAAMEADITLTLSDRALLRTITELAAEKGKVQKVHIEIDTGMGRLGVWHEEALDLIKEVARSPYIAPEGLYTHFSSAGRDKTLTEQQIIAFKGLTEELARCGIGFKYRHASNSIAVVDWPEAHFNMVRPGVMLYGVYPKRDFRRQIGLDPVMSLKTRVVFIKSVPAGRAISYGRTYITQKPTKIATLPIGYADGYGRILSNRANVLIKGRKARVVGMVTMDQTMLDVGHVSGVDLGEEVVLMGRQGRRLIPVEEVSKQAGTIPYEILAGITKRVPRHYLYERQPSA